MTPSASHIEQPSAEPDGEVFVLCGSDRNHLRKRVDALAAYLDKATDDAPLAALAFTLGQSIVTSTSRLAIVASSAQELKAKLGRANQRLADEACDRINDASGIYYFAEPLADRGAVAFLFPGEGSQYLGMLDGLADRFPAVQSIYDACDRAADDLVDADYPISRFTVGRERRTADERERLERELRRIDNAMFSVLISNWALFAVLQQMEVRPAAVAGHSAGELAALLVAGAMNAESHLGALCKTMQELAGHEASECALLAVGASRDALNEVLRAALVGAQTPQACVAMDNCPHQSIAVGDAASISRVEGEATRRGLVCERLELGRPYHTQWFEPYMDPLRCAFADVKFGRPDFPVYSCTTGELFPDSPDAIRELALSHWSSPVEFTQLVRNLHRDGVRIFIEVGPRSNLTSFVDDILRGEPHAAVPSNVAHRSAATQLCHMVAQLSAHHVPMRLDCLYEQCQVRLVDWEPPAEEDAPLTRRPLVEKKRATVVSPERRPPAGGGSREQVMRRHLEVSEQFLAVQSQVVRQFLQRRDATATGAPRRPQPSRPKSGARRGRLPMLGEVVEHLAERKLVAERVLALNHDHYAAHHTVGGRSISKVDPHQHGMPIMPMTFTLEMMMEAAAALFPRLQAVGVKNVRLSRWLAFYEENPCAIQISATTLDEDAEDPLDETERQVFVQVKDLGRANGEAEEPGGVAAVGVVLLRETYWEAPEVSEFQLTNERPCRTDLTATYNNLFHGELLQGLESIDRFGDEGIEAQVRVLPRKELFAPEDSPQFIGDPVLLDVAMHPAVTWHLEQPDQSGRIMLPFELKRLELFGPMPAEGARFRSRCRVLEGTHWHYTHATDVLDESGRLWCRIDRVKMWRFYLPFHNVNFHGPKDVYFLSDEWPEALPAAPADQGDGPLCCCVRLKEPTDLRQASLQLAGAKVMLSPTELEKYLSLRRPDDKKAEWLFGRAAAKDAVRILQRQRCGERPFMADVEILSDQAGRPVARPRGRVRPDDYPQVSIAHTEGYIAAIAATSPHVGIDIERVVERDAGFERIAFDEAERRLLDDAGDRSEWMTRFWCAKEALGKALGRGLAGGPRNLAVRALDAERGTVGVEAGSDAAREFPELEGVPFIVTTRRQDDLVVATTLCQPIAAGQSAANSEPRLAKR